MSKNIVLAYSGGLDTSCCISWLKEQGYKVFCFIADVGQDEDLAKIKQRALNIGAEDVIIRNLKQEFVNDYILPTLKAGAIYEEKYLLATALSRPLIGKHLVDVAHKVGASSLAHGCTGKGNDQVRFEVAVSVLAPKLEVIAPLRLWELKSREEEIKYAKQKNIPLSVSKKKLYSIDKNLWGVSIEGSKLENINTEPPEGCYQWTKTSKSKSGNKKYLLIEFKKGVPTKLNAKQMPLIKIIQELNEIGASFGIGRTDLIEDRLVGIKSREIYEAPAGWILYTAHKELESLTLDKDTINLKMLLAAKYAQLVYDGLWFSSLKESLDAFMTHTQKNVSGVIKLKLTKGNCVCVGRKSPHALYSKEMATYSKDDKFDHTAAEGFIKIWSLPYKGKKKG
ncbi:MAG: argininosuccinate synthase [Candidatus Omnitrophica bacterium]|nr:argininosuccinate synthase [Candidatus Omnitrophota bacterium]